MVTSGTPSKILMSTQYMHDKYAFVAKKLASALDVNVYGVH